MTRVPINESVLRWALERSGRAEVIGRKFPKLSEWLESQSQPTLRQLEEFAKATSTPLGYLFLPEPPEDRLPIPYLRTLDDQPLRRPSTELLFKGLTRGIGYHYGQGANRQHMIEATLKQGAIPTLIFQTKTPWPSWMAQNVATSWRAPWTEGLPSLAQSWERAG